MRLPLHRVEFALFSLFALSITLLHPQAAAQEGNWPPLGFRCLFNGHDLSGWHGLDSLDPQKLAALSPAERAAKNKSHADSTRQHWTVENGQLVNDGAGPYLTTNEDFENIEFWIDYNTVPKADSGIYLRATPQIQIWDWTEAGGKWNLDADKGSGGLWNNRPGSAGKNPRVLADKPFGEWNRFFVQQIGARTTIQLNGHLVVDHALMHNYWDKAKPLFRYGPIQLQTHGGEIRWKNIFVREVPWDEAIAVLRNRDRDSFRSVFNGHDLTGWKGAVDSYTVVDGTLACKPGKGGVLHTEEQYQDFVVRLEFRLPPAGNNGLAIRYPGQGDPAYAGACELQVLDSEHPQYAQLDARQYHGSAYGMAAAARGYLRPTGEWNFQEVTVQGSRIHVELNGYPILDTDLSTVTEFMANSPHPGKDLERGYFGFAGHSDPVAFRNIAIKRL